jgi:hypothetical protein
MGSANNIIHPTRLREIGSSVRRFERVMMSVSRTEIRCRWNQVQAQVKTIARNYTLLRYHRFHVLQRSFSSSFYAKYVDRQASIRIVDGILWTNGGFFTRQSCSMTGPLSKHANLWLK